METTKPRVGLALSGGGYRAAAFHLGTINKLYGMGLLKNVDVISSISGGSITGACYCSSEGDFESFYNELYRGLQTKDVITELLLSRIGLRIMIFIVLFLSTFFFLCSPWPWLFPFMIAILITILLKFQFALFPISKRIEEIYDQFFYKKKTLGQLRDSPELVIGSTNLQTARPFIFSRNTMQDSTYEFLDDPVKFKPALFPIARSVIASSCVPFAFTPITIDREFFEDPRESDIYHPLLVDGGVYDNQGIHKVMQKGRYDCSIVISSDAGSSFSGELHFNNTLTLLLETVNVFMSRIKKIQMMRNVYDKAGTTNKEVAYFSLGWDMENCIQGFIKNLEKNQISETIISAHQLKPEWIIHPEQYEEEIMSHLKKKTGYSSINGPTDTEKRIARNVGTNLTALSTIKLDCLIKQAEALTELQVKLYCPSLFKTI